MKKTLTFVLLLLAAPAFAQSPVQILTVDAPASVTACEVERSTDAGVTWVVQTPRITPAGTPAQCTFLVTPPSGRTLYRWAYLSGTTRTPRTDAGVYLCVGLAD